MAYQVNHSYNSEYQLSSGEMNIINGNYWDETIDGSPNNDLIHGNDGNDIIRGHDGDDILHGGSPLRQIARRSW